MPADDDRSEVLTSLPRSRPQRRSAKRGGGADDGPRASTPEAPTEATGAAPAAVKPRTAAAKPRAAARPKRVATEPREAKVAAAAAKERSAPAGARSTAAKAKATPRPRPVEMPRDDPPARPVEPPSSADVLQSAVRAAGELAQVGATIGREAVKSVLSRLRP
jgi:hypothetical protein